MQDIRSDIAARQLYYKMVQWAHESAKFDPIKLGPKAESLPSFEDFVTLTPTAPDLTQFIENDLALTHASARFTRPNGTLKSFNFGKKPFIVCIYGPTRSGKSHLTRDLLRCGMFDPQPEHYLLVTPSTDMLPHDEKIDWRAQLIEGNFAYDTASETVAPKTATFTPTFKEMDFLTATSPEQIDPQNDQSVYNQLASKGPVCVILDDCMSNLINTGNIGNIFQMMPSKVSNRHARCSGFYVVVILHNLYPSRGLGNNIMDLKNQANMHVISTKCHANQLKMFIGSHTHGLPPHVATLHKYMIVKEMENDYAFVCYNESAPPGCSMWSLLNKDTQGFFPMNLDIIINLYDLMNFVYAAVVKRERLKKAYQTRLDREQRHLIKRKAEAEDQNLERKTYVHHNPL